MDQEQSVEYNSKYWQNYVSMFRENLERYKIFWICLVFVALVLVCCFLFNRDNCSLTQRLLSIVTIIQISQEKNINEGSDDANKDDWRGREAKSAKSAEEQRQISSKKKRSGNSKELRSPQLLRSSKQPRRSSESLKAFKEQPFSHNYAIEKKSSKGETICRETVEKIYNKPFVNTRPSWLKNPETSKCLELDCYNAELKLAIEYNGPQHYSWPNFTGQKEQEYLKQVRRDAVKVERCREEGVCLIVVPYTVSHKNIPSYIVERLPKEL